MLIPPAVIIKSCGFISDEAAKNAKSGAIGTLLLYNSITTGTVPYVQSGDIIPIIAEQITDMIGDFVTHLYTIFVHEVNFKSSLSKIPKARNGKSSRKVFKQTLKKYGIL